jgi:hypothetical protein
MVQARQISQPAKRINIRSFDFDGCLFNTAYLDSCPEVFDEKNADERFFATNKEFFNTLSQSIKDENYDEVNLMVGSNRQCYRIDQKNFSKSLMDSAGKIRDIQPGSCFPFMEKISLKLNETSNLKCKVDKYLLSDMYGDCEPGTNFDNACKILATNHKHDVSPWIFDDSKFTLLYAQTQRIAAMHPTAAITFDFYDDRSSDILLNLKRLYSNYPHLLPKNLTLRLHCYSGNSIDTQATIQGTGVIDQEFHSTINEIAKVSGSPELNTEQEIYPQYHIADILKIKPAPPNYILNSILPALGASIGFFATGGIGGVAVGAISAAFAPEAVQALSSCCKKH